MLLGDFMNRERYSAIDGIRGIALLNMIFYHAIWDFVYLFNIDLKWYHSGVSYIWQQAICCTFIFLSGFCYAFGKNNFKRGLYVFFGGALISIVTMIIMPKNPVLFGVLTLIGSCMLIMIILEPLLKRCNLLFGFIISIFLFIFAKNINYGYLGFGSFILFKMPKFLYSNLLTAYFGFPMKSFYSTDYFSIFPWFFLYLAGYFLHHILKKRELMHHLKFSKLKPIEFFGQYSFGIYMLHQPVLYAILSIFL